MLPDSYTAKMKALLKDEYQLYEDSFKKPSCHGLRVNTSKISVKDFLEVFPYKLEPIPWSSDGFYYDDEEVSKHPFYYEGIYYLQEPSAMLPAEVLPIEENDIVLDACGAPGGKSTKLLNKLNNTGLLLSNDISASRANALLRNIERQGFEKYFVLAQDVKDLENKYPNTFDKILLDAPCSGEGMFRKEPSLIKSWLEKGNDYYHNIQKELIISCLNMLKDGGMMVYSTCTFDVSEDEDIIRHALNNFTDIKLLPIKMYDGFVKGVDDIGVKLFPHKVNGEGHFVCLLQKGDKKSANEVYHRIYTPTNDFFKHVNKNYYDVEERIINDSLYLIPSFDTDKVRLLRSGLLVGKFNKNNFEPSQAFAMSLKSNEFDQVIELDKDKALHYLKGETIKVDSSLSGLVLLTHNNHPLGFGKISDGMIKNKIDKGWIIR